LKNKQLITVAIDSPAAAGGGTQAKLIARHYNLLHLDTGRIYRIVGKMRLKNPRKFSYKKIKRKIKSLRLKDLNDKSLLSEEVANSAASIAKDKKIRKMVYKFQQRMAYYPPKKYAGSVLDGRDITSVILKDAMFKFFITANVKTRAERRFKEYKQKNKKISFEEVLKSLKNRDKSDRTRKYGPLKKTTDSMLLNCTKLSRKQCFLKIKAIMDRKLFK